MTNFCKNMLPEEVLKEAQEEFYAYQETGMSVMEMSHRSKAYDEIHMGAQADLKKLFGINDNYAVLFLQGGAPLQFSLVPLNVMPPPQRAAAIITGAGSLIGRTEPH